MGCYVDELSRLDDMARGGKATAAEKAAKRSRAASSAWRRACKKDPTVYGCECLDCA